MKNVNLDTYSPFHKTGHTSKGDQRKWKVDGIWYKADYMGYEGLAEVLVSSLLGKSSLSYPFVAYQPVQIEYKGQMIRGCVSRDFLKEGEILIPLEKLYRRYTGESLAVKLAGFSKVTERIQYLADVKMDYPLELPLEACLEHIEAKPFSADFDEQLEAAEALYGIQLQFHFSFKEVQRELDQIAEGYSDAVRERVEQLLRQQIRKYAYLIKA